MSNNSKSFNVVKNVSKNFTLFIQGFSVSDTLIFLCKIPVFKMVANAKIAQKFVTAMSFGRNRITISKFGMSQKENVSIPIRPMIMSILTRIQTKWNTSMLGTNGYIGIPLYISYIPRNVERWLNNTISLDRIKLGQNVIQLIMTLATYNNLSAVDAQTLGTMDALTLNELDYVAV